MKGGEGNEKQQRWSSSVSHGLSRPFVFMVGLVLISHLLLGISGLLLIRANDLGRKCFKIPITNRQYPWKFKIGMVTLSDESGTIPDRSFDGLIKLVEPNKQSYARKHGYYFIDASNVLDKRRPPSWSKILALRTHLPHYDWVFWNDADSLVTNPDIALENVLYSIVGNMEYEKMPDFIVTKDVTGINAGMSCFLIAFNLLFSRDIVDFVQWSVSSNCQPSVTSLNPIELLHLCAQHRPKFCRWMYQKLGYFGLSHFSEFEQTVVHFIRIPGRKFKDISTEVLSPLDFI
eukprot:Gb_29537 [translate_table: standard]